MSSTTAPNAGMPPPLNGNPAGRSSDLSRPTIPPRTNQASPRLNCRAGTANGLTAGLNPRAQARQGAGLITILIISFLLQTTLLTIFYFVEPLRKTRLAATEADIRESDQEAFRRLRELERANDERRRDIQLSPELAARRLHELEQQQRPEITDRLLDLKEVRDEVTRLAEIKRQELQGRTLAEVSQALYDQLHPLTTQLVAHARAQTETLKTPATPGVEQVALALKQLTETRKDTLHHPESFTRLQLAHRELASRQHQVIVELDAAQSNYTINEDRIRHENHVEYLVNLKRDEIGQLLGETTPLDPETMNDWVDIAPEPADLAPDWSANLPNFQLSELQQQAMSLYNDISRTYAATRSAEMALRQHGTMQDAIGQTNPPESPAMSSMSPSGTPGTVGEMQDRADAIADTRRTIEAMWQSAQAMVSAARQMTTGAAGTQHDTGGQGQGGFSRAAAQQAAAGRAGRFADMTVFQYGGGNGERGFSGSLAGGRDITGRGIRSGYRETGPGTPGAKAALLSEDRVLAQTLPGRIFDPESPRTGWLYIDTWYIIGPWENQGRINFKENHPPESLIDLDAEYTGKLDQSIAWQFHQSDNIRIKPPREMESATYYAYTEVYFAEETDMLVAVASDDAARVWLNDMLIWEDAGNSPWRLDEGFRKVRFRQGFNTLLLRIENGPVTCTFSLLMCPPGVIDA